ncbi:MAG: hypothetical protein HY360_08280 [Verrucomicrobia bacterium]|nr:hypothetical protein [Verrucomicrobiota bacterium]
MKTVVLIGNSIRNGYQATVQRELSEIANVWGPVENGRTSRYILEHFDECVLSRKPDLEMCA